jgi:linoleate 10R-lipoxygenase
MEMMVIQQARDWKIGSLNDFRRFLGLKSTSSPLSHYSPLIRNVAFATFTEWNRDPVVAAAATDLYQDVDNLELYVRIVSILIYGVA